MSKHNVYRDGKIHVLREQCATCIFRAGNRMHLQRGRVRGMVDEVKATDGCIPCHKTLDGDNAICRGQFDIHPTPTIELAKALDMIEYDDVPATT
jgi:hypothetical protein